MKSRGQEKLRNLFGIIQRRKASNESQVSWSLTQRSFHFSILPPSLKTKDWMGQTGLEKHSIVLIKQSSRAFLFSALPSRMRGGPIFNVSCIVCMKMMLPGNSISIPYPACPRSHLSSSLGRGRVFLKSIHPGSKERRKRTVFFHTHLDITCMKPPSRHEIDKCFTRIWQLCWKPNITVNDITTLCARQELHSKQITLLLEVETGHFPGLFPKWWDCCFLPLYPTCLWKGLKVKEWQGITGRGPKWFWPNNWLKKDISMMCQTVRMSFQTERKESRWTRRKFLVPVTCHSLGKTDYVFPFTPLQKTSVLWACSVPFQPFLWCHHQHLPYSLLISLSQALWFRRWGPPVIFPHPEHRGGPQAPLLPTYLSMPLIPY